MKISKFNSKEGNRLQGLCFVLVGDLKNKKGDISISKISLLIPGVLILIGFVYLVNAIQEIDNVVLNSTSGTNFTNENLSAWVSPLNASQKYIYDWKVNGSSIAVLNMPFEGGSNNNWTKDYSDYGNNGTYNDYSFADEFTSNETWAENNITGSVSGGNYVGTITDTFDPYMSQNEPYFNVTYNRLKVRYKSYSNGPNSTQFHYVDGADCIGFAESCSQTFSLINDGAWHILDVIINDPEWTNDNGKITDIRFDFDGDTVLGTFYLDYIRFYKIDSYPEWNSTGGYDGKGAYEFNGINDSIKSYAPDFSALNDYTISAWIYRNSDSGSFERLVSYSDSVWIPNVDVFLQLEGLDKLQGGFRDLTNQWRSTSSSATINTNRWYHVTMTYDSATGYVKLYIDGQQDGQADFSSNTPRKSRNYWNIGRMWDTPVEHGFNGTIDEVIIFNRSLSAEQISALYNNRTDLIVSQETNVNETWQVCGTPNDNFADGNTVCSNNLTIIVPNSPPNISSIILNSTFGTNSTSENLTAYSINVTDLDGNDSLVKVIYDWKVNGSSIAVLNMPFDGGLLANGSTQVKDYSDYGNNGTMSSVTYNSTGGYDGKGAYEFDGVDDYIEIANDNSLVNNITNEMTIGLWVKPFSYPASSVEPLRKEKSYHFSWTGSIWDIGFKNVSDGHMIITVLNSSDVPLNQWTYLVLSYDNSTIKLYVNGVLNASNSSNFTIGYNPSFSLYLGAYDSTQRYFNGSIDEFKIYNRALSAEQISALFNNRTDLIVSQETNVNDTWSVCGTPNDNFADGNTVCSNNLTIIVPNSPPNISSIILNSTFGTNSTSENLTAYSINVTDPDGNDSLVKVIYNWKKNGNSIAVLNMPFDGGLLANGNTKIKDYSDYGNNGTVVNATYNSTGGYDGKGAYEFDGVNDYININHTGSLDFENQTELSMFAWIKLRGVPASSGTILGLHSGADNAQGTMRIESDSKLQILMTNTSADFTSPKSVNNISIDDWTFVGFTYNGSKLKIYLNGSLDAESNFSGGIETTAANNIVVGRLLTGGEYFNGSIDEVMIYNRSLSAEQIFAIFNNRTDMIVSQETSFNDPWSVCGTPNDNTLDGTTVCSWNLTITLAVGNVTLNATSINNLTTDNLIANLVGFGNWTGYKYEWYKNGIKQVNYDGIVAYYSMDVADEYNSTYAPNLVNTSYALLNSLGTAPDYYSTGGKADGSGGYYDFDGVTNGDSLNGGFRSSVSPSSLVPFAISVWAKVKVYNSDDWIITFDDRSKGAFLQAANNWAVRFGNSNTNTGIPINTTWNHHVIHKYNLTHMNYYINGVEVVSDLDVISSTSTAYGMFLGSYQDGGYNSNVSISSLYIVEAGSTFNITDVNQLYSDAYITRYNFTDSTDTQVNDVWQVCVTPYTLNTEGTTVCSNNLTVLEGCPSTPQNWNVAMSDYLWVNSLCNLTGFNITFSGAGNFTINSTIYVNEINNLTSNMTIFMRPNATIWMGVN